MKKRPAFGRLVLFFILHSAFCVLHSFGNDLLTITVSLEGSFATVEDVDVPLRHLRRVGDPWVSSEFAWINGDAE